jgi:small-conductance mechanosensitive channel
MTEFQMLYLVIVGITGPLFIYAGYRFVKRTEQNRRRMVDAEESLPAIDTNSPVDEPLKELKQMAINNIVNRFSIIERLFVVLLVLIWIVLLIFPFLEALPATLVSIIVGASAVILGMAARPFIENVISGILISFSKPFHIGDTVLLGETYGTVEDITLTFTVIKIWDWRRHIIPNSRMLQKEFINYTLKDSFYWKRVEFRVSYDTDLELLRTLAVEAAGSSRHFIPYEPPSFWVMEMGEQSYKCWVAAWSDSPANAWELGNDIRTGLLTGFRKHGIRAHQVQVNMEGYTDFH